MKEDSHVRLKEYHAIVIRAAAVSAILGGDPSEWIEQFAAVCVSEGFFPDIDDALPHPKPEEFMVLLGVAHAHQIGFGEEYISFTRDITEGMTEVERQDLFVEGWRKGVEIVEFMRDLVLKHHLSSESAQLN